MIFLYSGRPGSGKSLDAMEDIRRFAKRDKYIITNFPVSGVYTKCFKNCDLLPATILSYVDSLRRNRRDEDEFLLVIDECQTVFNSRNWAENSRKGWIEFFTQHRKFGFKIILIAQSAEMIDKQIRACIEYDVEHRRYSRLGLFGRLFGLVLGDFVCVKRWYGSKEVIQRYGFRGTKQLYSMYDTNSIFA